MLETARGARAKRDYRGLSREAVAGEARAAGPGLRTGDTCDALTGQLEAVRKADQYPRRGAGSLCAHRRDRLRFEARGRGPAIARADSQRGAAAAPERRACAFIDRA